MTSQIVLGNGHGIAIASDSAVTMGGRRTYDTSEKIYPLPLPHSVAVLHAGSVLFHGMPYSTIINSWIQSLGSHQLRLISDYVESFRKFLLEELAGWCDIHQQSADFVENMNEEFRRIWHKMFVDGKVVSPKEALQIWKSEVNDLSQRDAYGQGTPFLKTAGTFVSSVEEKFIQVWSEQANETEGVSGRIEFWFDDVPRNEEINDLIKQYVWLSVSSHYPMSDDECAELTFAGYGTRSMIPAINKYILHGALNGSILGNEFEPRPAIRIESGFLLIDLIGQQRAIRTFLQGYDSALVETIKSASSVALEEDGRLVASETLKTEDNLTNLSISAKEKIGEVIEGAFDSFGEDTNLSSFRSTASLMPLASLAATAKSLIQIQELSLDSRGRLPTVGGQVRVGTLTKTHGFNWLQSDTN